MKLKLILTTAIVGLALALPAFQAPRHRHRLSRTRSSLTGAPADTTFQSPEGLYGHVIWELHATSGPNGENPSGLVRFSNGPANFGGPVTCLNVSGDTATITFVSDPSIISQPPINAEGNITVMVTDGQPDTFPLACKSARRPSVLSFLLIRPGQRHSPTATSRWSMRRCRRQRLSARTVAGRSSASRTRVGAWLL